MALQSSLQRPCLLLSRCIAVNNGQQNLIKGICRSLSSTTTPETTEKLPKNKELASKNSLYPRNTYIGAPNQDRPNIDYSYFKNIVKQATQSGGVPKDLFLNSKPTAADPLSPSLDTVDLSHIKPKLPSTSDSFAVYVNESETLQKLLQLGVDLSLVEKNKEAANLILKSEFERDLQPHLMFLVRNGVSGDQLGKFVAQYPGLFLETIENLQVRINYLESKRFTSEAIIMILQKLPKILSIPTKDLDKQLGFLQKEFKLSGAEVREAVTKVPKVTMTHRFIIHTAALTVKNLLGFTLQESKEMFLLSPRVFFEYKHRLEERFDFVHNVMGVSHDLIKAWPNILRTRRLVLQPRYEFLKTLGRDQFDPQKDNYVSLKAVATGRDRDFCHFIAKVPVEKYNEFLKTL